MRELVRAVLEWHFQRRGKAGISVRDLSRAYGQVGRSWCFPRIPLLLLKVRVDLEQLGRKVCVELLQLGIPIGAGKPPVEEIGLWQRERERRAGRGGGRDSTRRVSFFPYA